VALQLTKTAGTQSITGGQAVVFTLALTNQQAVAYSNAVLQDVLSASLVYVSGGSYDAPSRMVMWPLGTVGGYAVVATSSNAVYVEALAVSIRR